AIDNEVQNAKAGKPTRIIAKMNALLEPEIIRALYVASGAGVKIDLIIRGVCALRPGIAGLSENIRVRSIIGRFLEHTRIFYFRSGGTHAMYLSSADWMDRNFFRRIEICFPILEAKLKKRVLVEGLNVYLKDNRQAWEMDSGGNYHLRSARGGKRFCAQEVLLTELAAAKQTEA
ncbi:MAG: RNA degradosome polyphosphate kinase, partial [Nitrosospira sp.]